MKPLPSYQNVEMDIISGINKNKKKTFIYLIMQSFSFTIYFHDFSCENYINNLLPIFYIYVYVRMGIWGEKNILYVKSKMCQFYG